MIGFGLQFHHLGLAVSNPDRAVRFLSDLGYETGEPIHDPEQQVDLILCTHDDMPDIEVISANTETHPLKSFLSRADEMIYHTCFVSTDVEASIRSMKERHHVTCVSPPKPAILFDDKPVSFYYLLGFGLIELIHSRGSLRS